MPIVMPLAFSTNLQKIISAKSYDNGRNDDRLLCEDLKCRTEVIHVNEYERQYGDKKIDVEAFFRLKSKNFKHHDECKYNINNQVKIIARSSNSDILASINEGKYLFRINLVYSELEVQWSTGNTKPNLNTVLGKNVKTVKYTPDGKLTPYIATMIKVIELRTTLEKNEELRQIIKLEIKDRINKQVKEINWNNFYYTVDNYNNLYNYLSLNTCHHIICIEGRIRAFNEPSNKFPFYIIRLTSPSVKRIGSNNIKVPSLQLLLKDKKIYNTIKEKNTPNSLMAVFGIFEACGNKINKLKQIEYLNIQGKIIKISQIILF